MNKIRIKYSYKSYNWYLNDLAYRTLNNAYNQAIKDISFYINGGK